MSRLGPVALFCAGLNGDGVARNTVHLANALTRHGQAAEVVSLEAGPLADQLSPDVRLTLLGRAPGARSQALARALPALGRAIDRSGASALVSMGNHAHLAAWAALRTRPGLPRVYRISNEAGGPGRGVAMAALRTALQRLIATDATRLICVSAALALAAPFQNLAASRRLDILPNGVDVAAVRRLAREPVRHPWLGDGRPFLLAVGRLHAQKNYRTLLAGLAIARRADPDLRLLVLGKAGGSETQRLAAQVRTLGLEHAVRFEGEVANPFPLFARAQAYALTSRWEGASNSLLEALACGVPTLASRTAGNAAEVLDHGRFGRLVDPEDPRDIAEAILGQASGHAIQPGDRAQAFDLEGVMDRACAVILAARREHGGIQTLARGAGHTRLLGQSLRGPSKEY